MWFFFLFVLTQQSEIVNQGHRKSGVSRWTTKEERGPKSHKWQKRHQKVRIRTIRTHRCHKNSTASVGAVYVSDPDLLITQRRGKIKFPNWCQQSITLPWAAFGFTCSNCWVVCTRLGVAFEVTFLVFDNNSGDFSERRCSLLQKVKHQHGKTDCFYL